MKRLDEQASEGAKRDAMSRVEEGSPPEWQGQAIRLVRFLAALYPFFCSDDLWAAGLTLPPEPRALGPVLTQSQKLGIVEPTSFFVLTIQVERHRAPVRVWRSRSFGRDIIFDESLLPSRVGSLSGHEAADCLGVEDDRLT